MFFKKNSCECVPADVPKSMKEEFCKNYSAVTKHKKRLFLFACDQKMEHLNKDFYGPNINPDAMHPEHIFKIAHHGSVGALATQLGLIARYGRKYPSIPYIVKLNGKTDLIPAQTADPFSPLLWHVDDAVTLKENANINICGVGITLYLGSEYEGKMLEQAAQVIHQAHQHGLLAIVWVYLRGKSVKDETEGLATCGAAGIATTLGADFVKIKSPQQSEDKTSAQWLSLASATAGNTNIICAGGPKVTPEQFFESLYEQIHTANIAGCATGRNIFQRSLHSAIAMTDAIAAIVYKNKNVADALKIYNEAKKK